MQWENVIGCVFDHIYVYIRKVCPFSTELKQKRYHTYNNKDETNLICKNKILIIYTKSNILHKMREFDTTTTEFYSQCILEKNKKKTPSLFSIFKSTTITCSNSRCYICISNFVTKLTRSVCKCFNKAPSITLWHVSYFYLLFHNTCRNNSVIYFTWYTRANTWKTPHTAGWG